MKRLPIILALVCMSAITSSAEWTVEKHIDEMTDVVQYIVWTTGTVVQIDSLLDYTPQLQLRLISPKHKSDTDDIIAKFEMLLVIETDGLVRSGAEVLYRIDNEEAVHEIWTPSTDRRGAFSPHPHMLYKKLKDAKTLRIRYVTTFGNIRTTRFDVSGIQDAIQKIKEEVRLMSPDNNSQSGRAAAERSESETPPPDPKLVAKAKTTMNDVIEALTYAKTCAGPMPRMKSEITLTKPLPDIREEIAKRTREHAQNKLNPKRLTLLDIERRTHKLGTVWIQRFIADGKKWRTGFLESGGILSQIAPKTLQTYIDESTPEP